MKVDIRSQINHSNQKVKSVYLKKVKIKETGKLYESSDI